MLFTIVYNNQDRDHLGSQNTETLLAAIKTAMPVTTPFFVSSRSIPGLSVVGEYEKACFIDVTKVMDCSSLD